jgi:hypothetical protein
MKLNSYPLKRILLVLILFGAVAFQRWDCCGMFPTDGGGGGGGTGDTTLQTIFVEVDYMDTVYYESGGTIILQPRFGIMKDELVEAMYYNLDTIRTLQLCVDTSESPLDTTPEVLKITIPQWDDSLYTFLQSHRTMVPSPPPPAGSPYDTGWAYICGVRNIQQKQGDSYWNILGRSYCDTTQPYDYWEGMSGIAGQWLTSNVIMRHGNNQPKIDTAMQILTAHELAHLCNLMHCPFNDSSCIMFPGCNLDTLKQTKFCNFCRGYLSRNPLP